ncbi:MarR family winged helix-turn-helix transcriptional regulator [Flavobacterium filum]|uniref:MarR family winged helix-turn-helix transcriptional regulator n=1 Tax=Flavobacterium filum TaxID=370974 RepID=UPI0023F0D2C0|nr:MarR family winged helix-turn-helix transcriptional regulator [Flavobacterium filum]
MSVFNLINQNSSLDNKIVAGLERLSQVFRILLWEKAKEHALSPIQIQLLIFIQYHSTDKCTISYLAQEFNFTKPTISDAIKVLEQKNFIKKNTDSSDTRSYTIQLTASGKKIVLETENFANPITEIITKSNEADKLILWENISNLISLLNRQEIISIQRTCFNCGHYTIKNKNAFCSLLNQKLLTKDIRIDCEEFELA